MAGVIRVNLIGALGDQDPQNTFAWVGDAAILADALLLAEWLSIKLDQYFDANMTTGLLYGRAVINMWDAVVNDPLKPGIPHDVPTWAGDQTPDQLPQGTSLLLNFKAYGLPPNRKRMYVGGFTEADNTAGLPSSALIAQGNSFIEDMLLTKTVNTHDYLPIVLRLGAEGQYLTHRVLDSGFCSANWARLRSRRSR